MKKSFKYVLFGAIVALLIVAISVRKKDSGSPDRPDAQKFFSPADITLTGVYYYPEHWDESQWDRDFANIKKMGFEFVHMAEFAWCFLEPQEGKFDFRWLDKSVNLAKKYNLKIVLCTSTATPPAWLVRKYPEVLRMDSISKTCNHGTRQHCSHSSEKYRALSLKMISALAKRYGKDEAVVGWQIDNEPQARPTEISDEAKRRFQAFLQRKYADISKLNDAWGARFWGQMYNDFSQVGFLDRNPHQYLDMMRFAGDETAEFLDVQAREIRKHSKNQWITTNFIPDFKAPAIGRNKDLDFVSYTRYMIPGLEGLGADGYRIGSAYSISSANDFFRPLSNGVYGVMELQPGQVNWGNVNPIPMPNAVRLWLWSVWSGGAKFICTYRYREPLYGSELYHYGVVGPDGITLTRGGREFSQFISENAQLRKNLPAVNPSAPEAFSKRRAAILYSAQNEWELNRNKQTYRWNTEAHLRGYYEILKGFGAPVDIISAKKDFREYPFLVVPSYIMMTQSLADKLRDYAENGGHLVISPRSGYMDEFGRLYEKPFGGLLYGLIGAKLMDEFDMLPYNKFGKVEGFGKKFDWGSWAEIFTPQEGTEVWAKHIDSFYAGKAAVLHRKLGKGSVTYVGVESKSFVLEYDILKRVYLLAQTPVENLPAGVRLEYRDGFGIVLNYGEKPFDASKIIKGGKILIGSPNVKTADVVVWKCAENK